jgi:branched-chain amino acid aminotransferase
MKPSEETVLVLFLFINQPMSICFFKGKFMPLAQAGISLTDLVVQRGYGIFDFLQVKHGRPLYLEDHLDRFFNSTTIMHLKIQEDRNEMRKIVKELLAQNNLPHAGLKMVVAGGESPDGFSPGVPYLFMIEFPLPTPEESLPAGFYLRSHDYQRQFPEVKTVDYLMSIWLAPWLKEQGADDILYYNNGLVRECPRSNIFMVTKENVLVTPHEKILKGVTRKQVLSVARKIGIPVEERSVTLQEFYDAKEVFESTSVERIVPVHRLDDVRYEYLGTESVTHRLFEALKIHEREINYQ